MMKPHTHKVGRSSISISGLLAVTLLACTTPALADGPAGAAALVVNQASAGGGQLEAGSDVQAADTIRTGRGSAAVLAMADGTELALGEEAELTVLDFIGQAADSIGKFSLEVTSGAVRFATGTFAKPAYTVRTPSAVAAVRGTIFSMYVTDIGETYIAVEEGIVEVRSRRGTKFTVPAGAAMFLNTRGEVDGSLFNPLAGADLSGLPRGNAPTDAIRRMDRALQAAAAAPGQPATPRALGLTAAIEAGVIKAEDLPPFATKTPAYGKSKYGTEKDRSKGGGY